MFVVALASAAILGFLLVRTFRSPGLEAADVPLEKETRDTGRDPVPPQATMPGAPDSGRKPEMPAPPDDAASARGYVPPPQAVRRTYTDADLRAIAAARGGGATRDRGYLVALRQRRVDDLRERLDAARSADERAKLQAWLDGAVRDLERAQRE